MASWIHGSDSDHACSVAAAAVTRIAANRSGETVGKNSIGNKTSLALTRKVRLEKSVPTPEKPIVVRSAIVIVSIRNTLRLNKKVKTIKTMTVAMVKKMKFPSDLPMKSRSLDMGAIIRAPTASFSNSCDVARASPTTPAKVMAAQSTPGPASIAFRLVGSIAIAKIAITRDANITIAIAISRLRDSMRNSLSVSAQIIAREAVNLRSRLGGWFEVPVVEPIDYIGGLCDEFWVMGGDQHGAIIGFPLFDDAN